MYYTPCMTADLITRLRSRFSSESHNLTPNRIGIIRKMTAGSRIADPNDPAEQVLRNLLPEVKSKLVSDRKVEKFKIRVTRLLDSYTPEQLSKMDADCLKDDGRIDTSKFEI